MQQSTSCSDHQASMYFFARKACRQQICPDPSERGFHVLSHMPSTCCRKQQGKQQQLLPQ